MRERGRRVKLGVSEKERSRKRWISKKMAKLRVLKFH